MEQQQQQMTKDEFDPKCRGLVCGLRATFAKPYERGDIKPVLAALKADFKSTSLFLFSCLYTHLIMKRIMRINVLHNMQKMVKKQWRQRYFSVIVFIH